MISNLMFPNAHPAAGEHSEGGERPQHRKLQLPGQHGEHGRRVSHRHVNVVHSISDLMCPPICDGNRHRQRAMRADDPDGRIRSVAAGPWLREIASREPALFAHWQFGVRP